MQISDEIWAMAAANRPARFLKRLVIMKTDQNSRKTVAASQAPLPLPFRIPLQIRVPLESSMPLNGSPEVH